VFFDSLQVSNLQLRMGEDVWLRSNEANIQLTGLVTVEKVRNNYFLSGTLQAPRGTYRLIIGPVTREFVVRWGTVQYFGTPDLDAALDIEATHVVHSLPVPGHAVRGWLGDRREDVPRAQRRPVPEQPPDALHEQLRRHAAVPLQSRVAHRGELRAGAQLCDRRPRLEYDDRAAPGRLRSVL